MRHEKTSILIYLVYVCAMSTDDVTRSQMTSVTRYINRHCLLFIYLVCGCEVKSTLVSLVNVGTDCTNYIGNVGNDTKTFLHYRQSISIGAISALPWEIVKSLNSLLSPETIFLMTMCHVIRYSTHCHQSEWHDVKEFGSSELWTNSHTVIHYTRDALHITCSEISSR